MTQVKILQGISKLKEWDGTDGATISDDDAKKEAFKKISDAVKAINTVLTDTNNIPSGGITLTTADKKSTLTINAGDVKVNIDGNGGNQVSTDGEKTLNFADPTKNAAGHPDAATNAADIAKIFDGKNANVWNEFINAFADEHAKLVAKRDEALATDLKAKDKDIQDAAVVLATAETAATTYEGTVKNYDALNNALKNDLAAKEKALNEKQADFTKKTNELNKAIAAAPEIKVKDNVATQKSEIDAAEALIAPANTNPLKKAFVEAAINAGVKVQKDGKELKATDSEADLIAAFDTAKANTEKAKENIAKIDAAKTAATAAEAAIATPKTEAEDAKKALIDFESKASDKTGVAKLAKEELKSYRDNLDPKNATSEAKKIADAQTAKAAAEKALAKSVKDFKDVANSDKVTLKGTDADTIKKQAKDVGDAAAAATAAKTTSGATDDVKKGAIRKAIEAGVVVKNAGKQLTVADLANLDAAGVTAALDSAETNTGLAVTAMGDVKTKAGAVKDQDDIIEASTKAIADQKAKVKEISNTRAKAIATSENLDKGESDVLTALSDIFDSNARVEAIIAGEDADDIAEGVNELHSTLDSATKSLNKGNFTDIVIFNTNLATNTRLAKLSNPYNGNLALAYAVKNMAGEKFADNGSDALNSVVKEYTNRYNYDNNLWGNVFGGKAKVKDAANTDVYGFTLGYDKAFDNTIVGGFFTLAKAQSDGNNVKNDADNYSFGVYTRSYFGQNELDSKFAYGFAKNTLKTKSSLIGDNEGKYDSKYFDIALDYGYVFDIGNAKFVKPIFGLEYTNLKNDSFTAGGPVELNFAKTSVKTLNAKLGAEFRAYTEKGDYFYVTPGIERELSKSADDSVLNFAGSRNVTFDADKKKYTYATLKTGAEFKITDSLSTNINFGVKARSKNQFYNGTLGLSYKF
ncbi:autotransporter outer membrane beta-barrel domain-containing protein [Campylobacter concisus]|uniref:autotransporter outer membrane beta-barrel domain-containing protein n=1 Tax=Campylobacter concisus TaxID=199 RepID=UPI0015E1AE6E|nr:autotransporter outer membrane beta-barrel domain-containing protein [Campylobacter concisus]